MTPFTRDALVTAILTTNPWVSSSPGDTYCVWCKHWAEDRWQDRGAGAPHAPACLYAQLVGDRTAQAVGYTLNGAQRHE
jgi:hypothetical protein